MLSKEFIEKYNQMLDLNDELDKLLRAETGGRYGLCTMGHGVLFADPDFEHNLEELEELVGPTVVRCVHEGDEHRVFNVGNRKCVIVWEASQ